MFSASGLVPCQLCPRHSFAGPPPPAGFRRCEPCPEGTYTASLGATGPSHCLEPCRAGFFSASGLEPCSPCPLNFFQPALGQQRCLECPNSTVTEKTGAALERHCLPLNCSGVQCENRGQCAVHNHRTVCECRPGFRGPTCAEAVPLCDQSPCFNGATCENLAGTYRCICPQSECRACTLAQPVLPTHVLKRTWTECPERVQPLPTLQTSRAHAVSSGRTSAWA